jgi:rhodanese-related sulfurtransferase
MTSFNVLPELSVHEVAGKLKSAEDFILLDVREPIEQSYARFQDIRLVTLPLSRLACEGSDVMPENLNNKDQQIIVF